MDVWAVKVRIKIDFCTVLWEWNVGALCWIQVGWLTDRLEQSIAASTGAIDVIMILREWNALSFPLIFIRSDIRLVHALGRAGRRQWLRWIQIYARRSDYLPIITIVLFSLNAVSNVFLKRLVVLFQRSEKKEKKTKKLYTNQTSFWIRSFSIQLPLNGGLWRGTHSIFYAFSIRIVCRVWIELRDTAINTEKFRAQNPPRTSGLKVGLWRSNK